MISNGNKLLSKISKRCILQTEITKTKEYDTDNNTNATSGTAVVVE